MHFRTLAIVDSKTELEAIMKRYCDDYGANPIPQRRVKCDYWIIEETKTFEDIEEISGNFYYVIFNGKFYARLSDKEERDILDLDGLAYENFHALTLEKFASRMSRILSKVSPNQKVFILDLHN